MKVRLLALVLAVALLAACGAPYPDNDLAGTPWDEGWTMLGGDFGIETPAYGFELYNNNLTLSANDMYMVTWVAGEERQVTNQSGAVEQAFDAELYILMLTYEDEAGADAAVDDWVEHAASLYVLDDQITEEHNGVEYTLVTYTFGEDADTPYACGASAFAAFDKYGVTLELICADTFAEDPLTVLRAALDGCHVNAALAG